MSPFNIASVLGVFKDVVSAIVVFIIFKGVCDAIVQSVYHQTNYKNGGDKK